MLTQTRQYGQNHNGNIIDLASFTKPILIIVYMSFDRFYLKLSFKSKYVLKKYVLNDYVFLKMFHN